MKLTFFSALMIGISFISCNRTTSKTVVLSFEKDLIPEGIAIDSKSRRIFLNSLKNNKIVTSGIDGNYAGVFLDSNKYGYLSGFGMTTKRDTLYALGNSLEKESNKSILLLLNINTQNLIDKYEISNTKAAYLNDFAISSNNEIFITDSKSNKIYRIQRPNNKIEVYMDTNAVAHSNGITISDDNQYLYVGSEKGIRIIDVKTARILNKPNDFIGIDGLKFYKNTLIGIINIWDDDVSKNGLFRFFLNEKGNFIERKEKIIDFDGSFKVPTTFAILDNSIYFIKNTQLDNFNESTKQIIDTNKLEFYLLVQKKIE